MAYRLTRKALLSDLYVAYICAKRHKSNEPYVLRFQRHLMENLVQMRDNLWDRSYKPEPSSCFIIDHPKKREVFAAHFRDRIVHHLYYNYTHELFERTFIQDTYSCIPGRGTHYGIERMKMHIRSESLNHQRKCYVMKLDMRGYFMHINRKKLEDMAISSLEKLRTHRIEKGSTRTWEDVIDYDLVLWLTHEIASLNPKDNCFMVSPAECWDGLDRNKSLFYTNDGCGLPIGNLTSQLFSNVYLNALDQFMKRDMKCSHYGRYVDDAYVVDCDKSHLLSMVPEIEAFLRDNLGLELHKGKLQIIDAAYGVEFLGAYIKPFRTYVSNATLRRTKCGVSQINMSDAEAVYRSVNSFLGMLVHYSSYHIRCELFRKKRFLKIASFDNEMKKMNKPDIILNSDIYEQSIRN